jgi:ACS family tartrate transporter-like MFS transporter
MPIDVSTDDLGRSISTKVHRRVLPVLMAGWFIAYIDRFNVSYAALQMNEDLGLSAAAFGLGGGLFFLGYALFEVPSNMVLARVGARRWLARIMVTWGVITVLTAWISGPATFYAARLLLGIAEAGCFPGMAYCLSQWLAPRERAAALASLSGVAMVSGIVGGPMAAALLALDGVAGLHGWQWLFVVEGIPAVLIGVCVWRYLPDGPDAVSWLTRDERVWLRARTGDISDQHPNATALGVVIRDVRYWTWAMAFFCAAAAGSAVNLFRPVMLREMAGLGDTAASVLTAVPAIVGAIAVVYWGRHSTRHDERRWHSGVPMLVGALGVGLAGVAYGAPAAVFVAALSTISAAGQPPLFAAVSAVSTGSTSAVAIAFVNSIAALGGFLGPYAVGTMMTSTGGLAIPCAVAGVVMALGGCLALAARERRTQRMAAAVAVS